MRDRKRERANLAASPKALEALADEALAEQRFIQPAIPRHSQADPARHGSVLASQQGGTLWPIRSFAFLTAASA